MTVYSFYIFDRHGEFPIKRHTVWLLILSSGMHLQTPLAAASGFDRGEIRPYQ